MAGGFVLEAGSLVTFGLFAMALLFASWLAVRRRSWACWCFAGGAVVGIIRRVTAEWTQRKSTEAVGVSTANDIWLPLLFVVFFLAGLVILAKEWRPR